MPGAALVECSFCEGSGTLLSPAPCGHRGACPCDNEAECPECRGTGREPCDLCGSKAVAVNAGLIVCQRCLENGEERCAECRQFSGVVETEDGLLCEACAPPVAA